MVDPALAAAAPPMKPSATIKFLCSYGGKIVPRLPDAKLRYLGGHTRVLSVHRSVSFAELLLKMEELCGGSSVSLRCQLPTEDLDALVSIKSDEDLSNLIEEYDRGAPDHSFSSSPLKIRAFMFLPRSAADSPKSTSPSPSSSSSSSSSSSGCSRYSPLPPTPRRSATVGHRCVHQVPIMMPVVAMTPIWYEKSAARVTHLAFPHAYRK